ncbi:MAG TPA: NAD(P)/FAD-dependent oxidoreductase [Pseudonocardiaceae bacterium]
MDTHDVVVIGGGAAGLGAALTLSRARRSVLVVDAGAPRNAPAEGVHVYPGREGTPPAELRAIGRAEVAAYGGEFLDGEATGAERTGDGFLVTLRDGGVRRGRRLVVATGLVDELPAVPGVAELWGHDVLHCPYCHGWEVRDQPIGVLAGGPLAVHQALLWRQWSDDVVLFRHTADEFGEDDRVALAARGIPVVAGEVAALETAGGRLSGVRLRSGEVVPRAALAVQSRFVARSAVLGALGVEPEPVTMMGHEVGSAVPADPMGATAVPGVWVAGNVTDLRAQVVAAAAAGVLTGAAVNADLVAEDTRRAVAGDSRHAVPEGSRRVVAGLSQSA